MLISKVLKKLKPPLLLSGTKASALIAESIPLLHEIPFTFTSTFPCVLIEFTVKHLKVLQENHYDFATFFASLYYAIDTNLLALDLLFQLDDSLGCSFIQPFYVQYILDGVLLYQHKSLSCFKSVSQWCFSSQSVELLQHCLNQSAKSILSMSDKNDFLEFVSNTFFELVDLLSFPQQVICPLQSFSNLFYEFLANPDNHTLFSQLQSHLSEDNIQKSEYSMTVAYSIWLSVFRELSCKIYNISNFDDTSTTESDKYSLLFKSGANACWFCTQCIQHGEKRAVSNGVVKYSSQLCTLFKDWTPSSSELCLLRIRMAQLNYTRSLTSTPVVKEVSDDKTLTMARNSMKECTLPTFELVSLISLYQRCVGEIRQLTHLLPDVSVTHIEHEKFLSKLKDSSLQKCWLFVYLDLARLYKRLDDLAPATDFLLEGLAEARRHDLQQHDSQCPGYDLSERNQLIELYSQLKQSDENPINIEDDINTFIESQNQQQLKEIAAVKPQSPPPTTAPSKPKKDQKKGRFIPDRPPQHIESYDVDNSLLSALLDGLSAPNSAVGFSSASSQPVDDQTSRPTSPPSDTTASVSGDPEVDKLYSCLKSFMTVPGGEGQLFALHTQQLQIETQLSRDLEEFVSQLREEASTLIKKTEEGGS
ncbi:hypothetical protein GEMRC1_002911 [Eukaryota sp. GEM-RC1]